MTRQFLRALPTRVLYKMKQEGRSIGPPLFAVPYSVLTYVLEVSRHHGGDLRALGIVLRRNTVISHAV